MKTNAVWRFLSWALLAVSMLVLTACGGGGDSSGAPDSGATSSTLQVSEPVQTGNNTNTSTISVDGLSLSPGYLDLLVLTNSNEYQRQTLSVHVNFVGDGVVVGYAPGVQPPSWLSFTKSIQNARLLHQFDLPIDLIPDTSTEGFYKTTLRFVSGYVSGVVTGILDLPVYLHVAKAPPVYAGDITIGGFTGKLAGLARTIPLDFDGMVPDQVTAVPGSEMGDASQWLTTEYDWQTSLLTVRVKPGLKFGTYSGAVNVAYNIQGAKGNRAIPFKVIVQADAPVVARVAPGYMYAQAPNVLVLRGHALRKAATTEVRVGGVSANAVTVVSDTEIRASFNTTPPVGMHGVEVLLDAKANSLGDIVVVNKPNFVKQDILPPCSTNSGSIVYDPKRGNIIGFCDDTYYVMGQREGVWDVLATRKLADVDYAGWFRSQHLLTADQKYLVVSGKAQLILLDPATLQTIESRPIPVIWPDSAGYGYIWLEAALNNGKIVFTISGIGPVYFVYDLDNATLTRTQQSSGDAHIVNADRSALSLSTLQLVYVKGVNLQSKTSSAPDILSVTFFAAPDSWMADYAFPSVSPDGRKVAMYTSGMYDELYNLYDTTTIAQLGTISNPVRYNAGVLRFTESGDELIIVDGGLGRVDVYGARVNDTALKYSTTFQPYSYYAGLNHFYITPDQSALILYGASNGNGVGAMPPIKVIPLAR